MILTRKLNQQSLFHDLLTHVLLSDMTLCSCNHTGHTWKVSEIQTIKFFYDWNKNSFIYIILTSPVWTRKCVTKREGLPNEDLHPGQVHTWRLSDEILLVWESSSDSSVLACGASFEFSIRNSSVMKLKSFSARNSKESKSTRARLHVQCNNIEKRSKVVC
jgi:hypothetical protein